MMQKIKAVDKCIKSKCKTEVAATKEMEAAANKKAAKAREMMKKGDVEGARKVSQEAWDTFRTPKSRAIQNRLIACAKNKCKTEMRAEKEHLLKRQAEKCKTYPDSAWCTDAEETKKEIASLGGKSKTKKRNSK
jgi:hypothetical protein